ncbi:malonate decarboxylase holo-ACP synthase [Rouxiella sp. WC2420]|uniref:Malonate decarboxylase holo-ACP synthase n=1 Tax=Rouxiella sp. WC2420 TaxID=3234145 RepID=A0AB39VR14_9GAMM
MDFPRAHDLVWSKQRPFAAEGQVLPDWVASGWQTHLPLVVRRDIHNSDCLPVGVRGISRSQRAAAWIDPAEVSRIVTPESLVADANRLLRSTFVSQQPVQALITLIGLRLPWVWGVTGSCGYALATDIPVMHADSDLDLLIRCDTAQPREEFSDFYRQLTLLPCRADVQINTPQGGFSLSEWLRGGSVLLKTACGPRLVDNPWSPTVEEDKN